jgi:hypothetical protein
MSLRVERYCALSSVAGTIIMLIGLWPVAGLIPVPDPNGSAEQIAEFYRDGTGAIRAGLFIGLIGMGAYGPLCASITRRMLRMRPRQPVLAYTQLAAATVGWVFLFLPILIMSATAYRPERAAETTQGMNDIAWFVLVMDFVPFCVQYLAIAVAVFLDRSEVPVFPRWVAYLNLWVVVLFIPTGVITFFKTGPFTYGGLLGFYIPLAVFVVWLVAMPYAICRNLRYEELVAVTGDEASSVRAPTAGTH